MMKTSIFPLFFRGFALWLVIICAEIIHGTLRILFIEPLVGDFRARQIAVFSGALIILTISFLFVRRLRAANSRQLFVVGIFWVILTVAFEISFGLFVRGLSWERIGSDYDVRNGGLLIFGLIVMMFAPFISSKIVNGKKFRREF